MSDGLSFFDMADFPAAWRTVLRMVMRKKRITGSDLHAAAEQLPAEQRLSPDEVDDTVEQLLAEGYLTSEPLEGDTCYHLNLARKTVSRPINSVIWNALGLEAPDVEEEPLRRGGRRKLTSDIWERLDTPDEPAPERKPKRPVHTNLWDTVTSSEPPAKPVEPPIETPRPPRRKLWDALDADDKSASSGR